jgi:Zn finger protein HypA/HybF involved in hydrogenase expression
MCPGQDTQFWKPGDIFEIVCPACGAKVEFFKDDAKRRCPGCGHQFPNPKLNLGCAKWCKFADKCLGLNSELHDGKSFSEKFDGKAKYGVE